MDVVDGWLYAVRTFFITMVILGGVGVIFDLASFIKKKVYKLGVISGGLYLIAGECKEQNLKKFSIAVKAL